MLTLEFRDGQIQLLRPLIVLRLRRRKLLLLRLRQRLGRLEYLLGAVLLVWLRQLARRTWRPIPIMARLHFSPGAFWSWPRRAVWIKGVVSLDGLQQAAMQPSGSILRPAAIFIPKCPLVPVV